MKFALFNKIQTNPGQRESLTKILLDAAAILQENSDCLHYVIGSAEDPSEVYIWEAWTSEEAHDNSLEDEALLDLIKNAKPLIAGMEKIKTLEVEGGKGIE